jgi:hypothetical protein
VTDVFLIVGTWPKFRRHVSQKRRLTFEYTHTAYKTVLIFEFFLPLTNETVLRNALDALFFRDTLQKKLLALGFTALKSQFEQKPEESDNAYLNRLIAWLGKHFRGYSIGHVSGRFRAEDEPRTMQDAAGTQERGGRYLIDETTAVTRFIFPCENPAEAQTVSWFFHRLFVESVSQVAGEAEIWMIESGIGGLNFTSCVAKKKTTEMVGARSFVVRLTTTICRECCERTVTQKLPSPDVMLEGGRQTNARRTCSGKFDGTPRSPAGLALPILRAARRIQGLPDVRNVICRNEYEHAPAITEAV